MWRDTCLYLLSFHKSEPVIYIALQLVIFTLQCVLKIVSNSAQTDLHSFQSLYIFDYISKTIIYLASCIWLAIWFVFGL